MLPTDHIDINAQLNKRGLCHLSGKKIDDQVGKPPFFTLLGTQYLSTEDTTVPSPSRVRFPAVQFFWPENEGLNGLNGVNPPKSILFTVNRQQKQSNSVKSEMSLLAQFLGVSVESYDNSSTLAILSAC